MQETEIRGVSILTCLDPKACREPKGEDLQNEAPVPFSPESQTIYCPFTVTSINGGVNDDVHNVNDICGGIDGGMNDIGSSIDASINHFNSMNSSSNGRVMSINPLPN